MKKVVKKLKQSLSILLAVAMVVTCVPQTATLAQAAEADAIDAVADDTAELEVSTVDAAAPSEDMEEISEEGGEAPAAAAAEVNAVAQSDEVGILGWSEGATNEEGNDLANITFDQDTLTNVLVNKAAGTQEIVTETSPSFSFQAKGNNGYEITGVTAKIKDGSEHTVTLTMEGDDGKKITSTTDEVDDDYTKYTVPLTTDALTYEDSSSIAISDIASFTIKFTTEIPQSDITYKVTIEANNATVEFTNSCVDGDVSDGYTTKKDTDITFTVTPASNYKLKDNGVTYTVKDSQPEIIDKVIEPTVDTYTIDKEDITGDITIKVETEKEDEDVPATSVDVAFDIAGVAATDHFTVYPVEGTSGSYTKGAALTADNKKITSTVGGSVLFIVEPAAMYKISSTKLVNGENTATNKNGSNKTVDGARVTVYQFNNLKEGTNTVTITTALDRKTANRVRLVTASEDIHADQQFEVTSEDTSTGEAEVITNTAYRSDLVIGKTFYSAKDSIGLTITAKEGYKITKVQKETVVDDKPQGDPEDVESLTYDGSPITITHNFADTELRYIVTAEVQGLEQDGGKVTFKVDEDASEITLNNLTVNTEEGTNVEEESSPEANTKQYNIKSGATYLEFSVEAPSYKVVPTVKVGTSLWSALNSESPYNYKVPAGLLSTDTDIVIGDEAATMDLTIWYNDEEIDEDTFDLSVQGDDEGEYEIIPVVDRDDEGNRVYYADCVGIPVDATATLKVSAQEGYQILSYSINGADAESVNAFTMSVDLTFDKDIEITINSGEGTEEPKPAIESIKIEGVDKEGKLTQTVDTVQEYKLTPTPADAGLDNLELIIDADEPTKSTLENIITLEDGSLKITAPAVTTAGLETLTTVLENATFKLADSTKSDDAVDYPNDAIVTGSEFKLVLTAPEALQKATPTVAEKSVSDVSLTLTLGTPANVKLATLNEGKYWYAVTVTPDGDVSANDGSGVKPADTYYFAKADAASQNETIKVFADEILAGSGKVWKFKVSVKLVQTTNGADPSEANLTGFASNPSAEKTISTKAPYYATAITLKKGATALYTGQKDVKIATINFGTNTTFKDDNSVTVEDLTNYWVAQDKDNSEAGNLYVKGGDVYMSLPVEAKEESGEKSPYTIGKHTIRVTAAAPDKTNAAYKDIVVTVNRGIEELRLSSPSDKIYRDGGTKNATLKFTPVYNNNAGKGDDYAPKTKKVTNYVLVAVDKDAEGNDVIFTDPLVSVASNGTVTVKKGYQPTTDSKFYVRATANDWTGNPVVGYSDLITITADKLELGEVVIVKEAPEGSDYLYEEVVASSNNPDKVRTSAAYRNSDGEYGKALVRVLKPSVDYSDATKLTEDSFVPQEYLTFKSTNVKALAVDAETGYVTVIKAAKNITIKVSAKYSGTSAALSGLEIKNEAPIELGLRVVEVKNDGNEDDYSWKDGVGLNGNEEYSKLTRTFTGTPNSVLKLTVMRKFKDGHWEDLDDVTDLKVTIKDAQKLTATSAFNQEYTIIANKAKAKITLTYKDASGVTKKPLFEINNEGVKTVAAPKGKASKTALVANYYNGSQNITYTITKDASKYAGKIVWIYSSAADRAKNAERYASLEEAAGDSLGWQTISDDGSFTLRFNNHYYDNDENNVFWEDEGAFTNITAGSYKLMMVYGSLDVYGDFVPETKPVTLTLKATAPKKGSYKPASAVKMSVFDTAAGKQLAGTGKNYDVTTEKYTNLQNANFNGQANHFRDFFELDPETNTLKLVSDYSDAKYDALKAALNLDTDEALINYITASTTKDAKNDRIGYVDYSVDVTGLGTVSGTAKITVSFNNKKSIDTYTLSNTTILDGAKTATVNVLLNKKVGLAEIVDAYVDGDLVLSGTDNTITFDATGFKVGKNVLNNVYVVPANNLYAETILDLKAKWQELDSVTDGRDETAIKDAKDKYVAAVKHGIALKTTITVGAKASTGKKISIAKADLSRTFTGYGVDGKYGNYEYSLSGYWGPDGNYWVNIPYTKNMDCEIAEIVSNDKLSAEGESLIHFDTNEVDLRNEWGDNEESVDMINVCIQKEELAKAVAAGKAKYSPANKKQTYTVKGTIYFADGWKFVPNEETVDDPDDGWYEPIVKDENDKEIIKSETFSFKLTMPTEQKKGFEDAVAAVEGYSEEIVAAWDWNGEGLENLPESDVSGNCVVRETLTDGKDNRLFYELESWIRLVQSKVAELVPDDTNVRIDMLQEPVDKAITFAKDDFEVPSRTAAGSFTVRMRLVDVNTLDPKDQESIIEGTQYKDVSLKVTIPATKEKPEDYRAALKAFIAAAAEDSSKYFTFGEDGWRAFQAIQADVRSELGIDDASKTTMRVGGYFDEDAYTVPTTAVGGLISGTIEIWGYRYGGENIKEEFTFTTDKLPGLEDTIALVKAAVSQDNEKLVINNETTADYILGVARDAVKNPQYQVDWKTATQDDVSGNCATEVGKEAYKIERAERGIVGHIRGKLLVTDLDAEDATDEETSEEEKNVVTVDLEISALPENDEVVKAVKVAVGIKPADPDQSQQDDEVDGDTVKELVLAGRNTEDGVKEAILAAAKTAVKDSGFEVAYQVKEAAEEPGEEDTVDFSFTAATSTYAEEQASGSLSFTLELTDLLAATEEDPTVIQFNKGEAYTVVPCDELQTLAEAKKTVEEALEELKADASTAATTEEAILQKAKEGVEVDSIYELSVTTANYVAKDASVKEAGKITCDVILSSAVDPEAEGVNPVTIKFEATIAKVEQSLEEAKQEADKAIDEWAKGHTWSNEDIKEGEVDSDILDEIVDAVKAVVALDDEKGFTVTTFDEEDATKTKAQEATNDADGEIIITVVITENKQDAPQKEEITKTYYIAALSPQDSTAAEEAARGAIEGYIEAFTAEDAAKSDGDFNKDGDLVSEVQKVLKSGVWKVEAGTDVDEPKCSTDESSSKKTYSGKIKITCIGKAEKVDTEHYGDIEIDLNDFSDSDAEEVD